MTEASFDDLALDHRSAAGPTALRVRGSLIASSLQTLRALGFYSHYLDCLPESKHASVLFAIANGWHPIEVAMDHYQACEAMNLSNLQLEAIGEHVSKRIMGTLLGTMTRASRSLGASPGPMVLLQRYGLLWDRLLQGGSCVIRKTGPKDAKIDSAGVAMFRYHYFQVAYTGVIRASCLLLAKSCEVRILTADDTSSAVLVSWV